MLSGMQNLEIPIRTGFFKNSNFSELNDDAESIGSPPSIPSKKVRFESESGSDDGEKYIDEPKSEEECSLKGKKNIEDLLQYANQVNDYVAQNLEKINTFRSDLLSDNFYGKPSSDMATQATTLSASMSNFELSDNEYEDQENNDRISLDSFIGDNGSSSLNKSEKDLLESMPVNEKTGSNNSESDRMLDYSTDEEHGMESNDYTLENSPDLRLRKTDMSSTQFDDNIRNMIFNSPIKLRSQNAPDDNYQDQNTSLILKDIISTDTMAELSPEQGIEVLNDTVCLILDHSKTKNIKEKNNDSNDNGFFNDNDIYDPNEFSNFIMKSTPSISYKDLILRIQSKCMFGSIVYVTAAFLLQTLLLSRDPQTSGIVLRNTFEENEAHRLIIASIRVATKLLEDCVHSHQYFCKVCGVSRRLLTKLEVSLIICLKNDALIVSSEKLAASIKVRDELKHAGIS